MPGVDIPQDVSFNAPDLQFPRLSIITYSEDAWDSDEALIQKGVETGHSSRLAVGLSRCKVDMFALLVRAQAFVAL